MLPGPTQQELPEKERRSRRTHKNSRDGCPNCRANRIKCGEQLPSCIQCVRKHFRCGYLDFSSEKLNHIRLKNESLTRPQTNIDSTHSLERSRGGNMSLISPQGLSARTIPAIYDDIPEKRVLQVSQVPSRPPLSRQYSSHIAMSWSGHMSSLPSLFSPSLSRPNTNIPKLVSVTDYNTPQRQFYIPPSSMPQRQQQQELQSKSHLCATRNMNFSPFEKPPFFSPEIAMQLPQISPSISLGKNTLPPAFSSQCWIGQPQSQSQPQANKSPPCYEDLNKRDICDVPSTERYQHSSPDLSVSANADLSLLSRKLCEFGEIKPKIHLTQDASRDGRKRVKLMKKKPRNQKAATSISLNVRSAVYSHVLHDITHDVSPMDDIVLSNYEPWEDEDLNTIQYINSKDAVFSEDLDVALDRSPESEKTSLMGCKSSAESQGDQTPLVYNFPSSSATHSVRQMFLPGCTINTKKFSILEIPENLQSNLYEQTVKDLTQEGARIRFWTKQKSKYAPPIYSDREFRALWIEIFLRATTFELFFIYFIDKSINVLTRASSKVLNGYIVCSPITCSPESDISTSCLSMHQMIAQSKPQKFFYNKEELDILIAKSYITYGKVIRELRNSITLYSSEFPARMSLFSAWACYTNPQSDLNTFDLMIRGTLLLIKTSIAQHIADKNLEFSMYREFSMFEVCVRQSLFPDYNISTLQGLAFDFKCYTSFVEQSIRILEEGKRVSEDLRSIVSDPVFRHDLHELKKFFEKLFMYYIPRITEQNRLSKVFQGYKADQNFHFVSPRLLFELSFEWCCMYPDENMYLSSQINPMKRVLYMFYHALAKCLDQVLTPIKSVSLVDPCNVMCAKIGTMYSKPNQLETRDYRDLIPLLTSLMRTIRFFEMRQTLLSYHVLNKSVLDKSYIRLVPYVASSKAEAAALVEILPAKIVVRETQVKNISRTNLGAHNFPLFDDICDDLIAAKIIHRESNRQYAALQNEPYKFDYCLGFSNHDFNPQTIVDYYCFKMKEALNISPEISQEKLAIRIENMLSSRDAISNASNTHVLSTD